MAKLKPIRVDDQLITNIFDDQFKRMVGSFEHDATRRAPIIICAVSGIRKPRILGKIPVQDSSQRLLQTQRRHPNRRASDGSYVIDDAPHGRIEDAI